jgi:hypothetical protein
MKRNVLFFVLAFSAILNLTFVTSCSDDDDDSDSGTIVDGIVVSENISGSETWTADETYVLDGRITVLNGATLTIEAGTVIKGAPGTGANATALLVAKGGTLIAQGTASAPIIMTTTGDKIESGDIVSPNDMDPTFDGAWGGLIVLGDAPISADASPFQIEGIPASDQNGLYGGTTADDNSGIIQYVSIRHGGSNIGEGNEINGITLGGVGSGTTIDHIEVVANQDDGIECFGGTVNVSDILVWNQGDDAFDMDQDYTGTIENFIGIMGDMSDHAMELDGPEGTADNGGYTLTNGSLKGWNDDGEDGGEFADLRSGCKCTISNCYFFNFSMGADLELDNDGVAANYEAGDITFSNLEFNFHLTDDDGDVQTNADVDLADVLLDKGKDASDAFAVAGMTPADVASKVDAPTVGADKSEFTGWTWADVAGELADF